MKTALILEGGAMRGLYTAGVLDILLEEGIETDACFAVSAGALFGINYKSKNKGRVLRYNLKYGGDARTMGWISLIKTGNLMHKEFWFEDIPFKLDPMDTEAYKNSKTKFVAVVTNMITGKAEYKSIYDLKNEVCMEYLRASGSLPFLSKPVEIDGIPYLDGGIADSIPVEEAIKEGYEKIIIVLTRPENYRKNGDIHGAELFYKKYPEFSKTLKNRNKMYNKQCELINKLQNESKIFVLRPSEFIDVKRTEKDKDKLKAMYSLGVKDCKSKLNELKDYLKSGEKNE